MAARQGCSACRDEWHSQPQKVAVTATSEVIFVHDYESFLQKDAILNLLNQNQFFVYLASIIRQKNFKMVGSNGIHVFQERIRY